MIARIHTFIGHAGIVLGLFALASMALNTLPYLTQWESADGR